jgi:hypothetical protein
MDKKSKFTIAIERSRRMRQETTMEQHDREEHDGDAS